MTFILLINQEATSSSSPSPCVLCCLGWLTFLSSQVSAPAGLCAGCFNITVEQIYFWKQKNFDLWTFWNSRNSIDSFWTRECTDLKTQRREHWCNWNFLLMESIFQNRNPQTWLFFCMSHNHMSYSHIEVKNVVFSPLRTLIAIDARLHFKGWWLSFFSLKCVLQQNKWSAGILNDHMSKAIGDCLKCFWLTIDSNL